MAATLEREQRLEALSLAGEDVLVGLADEVLESLPVTVSRGPAVGLLMLRVEEPSDRLSFNFAEVTVSEAEVVAGDIRGYAMVMGRFPEKALAGAILDAALEAGHPISEAIEEQLRYELAADCARRQAEWARIEPTTVKFDEMAP